jgi:hypothetical protein
METVVGAEPIRRTISLPAEVAEKIEAIAVSRHVSANRAIVELLGDAIVAFEQRRAAFLELADRFQKSTESAEIERLREELAQMTFGSYAKGQVARPATVIPQSFLLDNIESSMSGYSSNRANCSRDA